MKIRVNGKDIDFLGGSVKDLMNLLKLDAKNLVVEKNESVIHGERYSMEEVHEGDVIEIVHFVGGG